MPAGTNLDLAIPFLMVKQKTADLLETSHGVSFITLFSLPVNSRIKSEVLKLRIDSAQGRAYGHMGLAPFHANKE